MIEGLNRYFRRKVTYWSTILYRPVTILFLNSPDIYPWVLCHSEANPWTTEKRHLCAKPIPVFLTSDLQSSSKKPVDGFQW